MIYLRRFRPKDLMNIMQLVGVTLGENYHPSFYINLHNFWPEGFIVATISEQIVGFVLGTLSDSKTCRILMISVYPYYQRRGGGSTLRLLIGYILECFSDGLEGHWSPNQLGVSNNSV